MKKKIKFVVYGNSDVTLHLVKAVLDSSNCEVVGIVTLTENLLPLNSLDICSFAKELNIKCIVTNNINSAQTIEKIKSLNPDIAISTWSRIIKEELLNSISMYTIGTHPTNLPLNRGRHPLHWFICLDIQETVLSFFKMEIGIDDGDIILKHDFKIQKGKDINDFNAQMSKAAYDGMLTICKDLYANKVIFKKQNNDEATYFRKRNFFDTVLDPRMSSKSLINHVNSFCEPYSCASLIIEKNIYYINKAEVLQIESNIVEYGKVISMTNKYVDFKAEDKFVRLYFKQNSEVIKELGYIYTPMYYFQKYSKIFEEKFNEL